MISQVISPRLWHLCSIMKKSNLKKLALLVSLLLLVACSEYKSSSTEISTNTTTKNAVEERVVIEETTVTQKLAPLELTIDKGTMGHPTIDSLLAKEQNPGDANVWANYLQLSPAADDTFSGVFRFKIEGEISKVQSLALNFNYLGYGTEYQTWKVEAKDQVSGEWVKIADNSSVVGWTWSEVVVEIDQPENFVDAAGSILIRYSSETPADPGRNDNSFLDYLALDVTYLAR